MRRVQSALSIADLAAAARRQLPRGVFGFVSGGSEDEASVAGNHAAFARWRFLTDPLTDVSHRSQQIELFGTRYASPIGIAPMGASALCWFEGDLALASAAKRVQVPFVLSAASTVPLERVLQQAPGSWYQAYLPASFEVIAPLLARLQAASVQVLVITVDVPVASSRENELRNGFSVPLRLSPALVASGLARPRWLVQTLGRTLLRQGVPHFENFTAQRGGPIIGAAKPGNHRAGRDAMTWDHVARIRERWPGKLVIKGVLRAEHATRARTIGADGVIVSNHGGRQLDGAVAPLDALPAIVRAVPGLPILLDGGVRRGTDVLKALALGAQAVFVGRPAMYGLAVGGEAGVLHALDLLRAEIDIGLALLGCPDVKGLCASHVVHETSLPLA